VGLDLCKCNELRNSYNGWCRNGNNCGYGRGDRHRCSDRSRNSGQGSSAGPTADTVKGLDDLIRALSQPVNGGLRTRHASINTFNELTEIGDRCLDLTDLRTERIAALIVQATSIKNTSHSAVLAGKNMRIIYAAAAAGGRQAAPAAQ
jgi:hypothetical protein